MDPGVSIIIPLHKINDQFTECINHCLSIDYSNYEIIVVTDKLIELNHLKVRLIHTGEKLTGPAEKRDLAINICNGEICAFIDDDAFPATNWLKNAVKHFNKPEIAAVGGPGLTPEKNNLMQRASGTIYSSILGGGGTAYRYIPKKSRYVVDYPAYNLLVRKSIIQDIGGFNSKFYGGEDTKLCLEIIKKNKKIFYDPNVIVYHHRRPLFKEHLHQIWNVGKHRGYFVKKFPETSFKLSYFLPSTTLIIFILGMFLSIINNSFQLIFFIGLSTYLIAGFLSGLFMEKNLKIAFLVSIGIPATHFTYGIAFIKGLTINFLER